MLEILVLIALVAVAIWLYRKLSGSETRTAPPRPTASAEAPTKAAPTGTYRPQARTRPNPSIVFRDASASGAVTLGRAEAKSLEGLHDAFTGARLEVTRGLYRCQSCQVYYHKDSYAVLTEANGGRCIACLGTTIVSVGPVSAGTTFQPGRDHTADIVTLQNYQSHAGTVVTFEGYVPRINLSRDGKTFAIMFENTVWTKGLKMIVFRGKVGAVGGREFLLGLRGRTVRVRGLLVKDPTFGYEIIVSERSMILDVK